MVQQFKVPETESELRQLQDKLYSITKEQTETGAFRGFRGLLEIMASETVIMTAIHNIKANKGAETAGTDGRTMRADILQQDLNKLLQRSKGRSRIIARCRYAENGFPNRENQKSGRLAYPP